MTEQDQKIVEQEIALSKAIDNLLNESDTYEIAMTGLIVALVK